MDTVPLTASAFFALNLLTINQIAFDFRAPSGFVNYVYTDLDTSQTVDTGIPVSDEGVHGSFTLTAPSEFTLTLTPIDGTPSASFSGMLTSTPIRLLRFSFQGSGDPSEQRGYFNSISVPEPGGAGETLALFALGWVWRRNSRRAHSSHSGGTGGPNAE